MRILKMIIVCILIIGGILMMSGCSNGKTASARDVEFLTSSEYWYHYDEATGESEKMSFSDDFTFYWGCECGEPVGNSDCYEMYDFDKETSIIKKVIENSKSDIEGLIKELTEKAIEIEKDDIERCKKIGDFGAEVVPKGATILTHCNAGALATVGYGTALGVVRSAFAKDNTVQVFADETRPRQQGARITTLELTMDGIPTTLITDGMCSYFMKKGMIDMVVVGADRIAANGDTANKIGTYTVAISAKYHNVPFYVAAPLSTIDTSIKSGDEIIIEERSREEVTHINGKSICAENVNVINPGFDVTPNELITGIITEVGILKPDYQTSIAKAFNENH